MTVNDVLNGLTSFDAASASINGINGALKKPNRMSLTYSDGTEYEILYSYDMRDRLGGWQSYMRDPSGAFVDTAHVVVRVRYNNDNDIVSCIWIFNPSGSTIEITANGAVYRTDDGDEEFDPASERGKEIMGLAS